jgi:hypothetical protein
MYFSTRPSPVDLYFSADNIKIKPVDAHKHLDVTLSADGKWFKHINNVVVKASRQIAVQRKIKFKVSRNFLENIYMTFIRPLLEYSCEAWDSCTVADAHRIEQFQLEAARIVTGLTAYASLSSLYAETKWEKLNTRGKFRKLSLFYNIVMGDTPDYLSDLLPRTVNQANNYNLRNANNFAIPRCRLTLYQNSFFPATIHLWNNLPQYIRDSPSNYILKSRLKTYYITTIQ